MMRGWGYGAGLNTGGRFWWIGLAMMAVRLIVTVVLIVWAVKMFRNYSAKTQANNPGLNNALQILRERYAKGEIDTEEFNRRREDLMR